MAIKYKINLNNIIKIEHYKKLPWIPSIEINPNLSTFKKKETNELTYKNELNENKEKYNIYKEIYTDASN